MDTIASKAARLDEIERLRQRVTTWSTTGVRSQVTLAAVSQRAHCTISSTLEQLASIAARTSFDCSSPPNVYPVSEIPAAQISESLFRMRPAMVESNAPTPHADIN